MELLPQEFINFARYANISTTTIDRLIGNDLSESVGVNVEELRYRELLDNESLSMANWKLLEKPSKILLLKKIARRDIFQEYKLFCDNKCKYITLLGITKYNAILFEEYDNKNKFVHELVDKYKTYQTIDQDLTSIENLTKDEWFIIVALIELFLEKYPTPDSKWEPTELLLFTQNSLIQIINESEDKIEDQTWWQHWKKISKDKIPNKDDIEIAILMLANRKLVGYMSDEEGEDVYYIGQGLLWMIRSLSWWDRGFVIEDTINNVSFYLLEASSLFILINDNDVAYSLINIDGGTNLQNVIDNFLLLDNKKSSKIIKEQIKQRFCTNCGKELLEGAKFCSNCGAKVGVN